jgi:hypothetical protein
MMERLKEPVLDPSTGEPVYLQELMSSIHTRRSRAAAIGGGDIEMAEDDHGGRKPKK